MTARAAALALAIALLPGRLAGAAAEDYAAAVEAQANGDCAAMIDHLERFLAAHPGLRDSHTDFYLQLKVAIGQCSGAVHVSGTGDDALAVDPLPAEPPAGVVGQ